MVRRPASAEGPHLLVALTGALAPPLGVGGDPPARGPPRHHRWGARERVAPSPGSSLPLGHDEVALVDGAASHGRVASAQVMRSRPRLVELQPEPAVRPP